jgi:hypothetical protein
MKKELIFISLFLVSICSCSITRTKKVILNNEKGRVVVVDDKYSLYLDAAKIQQYLDNKSNKSKEEEELFLTLKNNNDTLFISKPANDFFLKEDIQVAIYPILYDSLIKGNCSILEKQFNTFVKKIKVVTVKDKFAGHQIHFIIDEYLFLTRVFSLGE